MTDFNPRSQADLSASLSVALRPSTNGRFLVRHAAPEEPFFYLGDTAWELFHRLNDAEAEHFLRNRAAKGFNAVMVVIMAEHGGLDYPNREGAWPFHPAPDSTPEKYIPDISRPNAKYFAFIDRILPLAASLGITIVLVPTWGRYVNGGYYGPPVLFDEQNAYEYCKFLGKRYPFHPWVLGGDSNRFWNVNAMDTIKGGGNPKSIPVVDFGNVTEAMARGLREGEEEARKELEEENKKKAEGYETVITFHSAQVWLPTAPESSASAQFPDADWLTFDCIQTGHHDNLRDAPTSASASESSAIEVAIESVKEAAAAAVDAVKEALGAEKDEADGNAQAGGVQMPMWYARSGYVPVRKMYETRKKDGTPRPVIDLEAHYENTHHWFTFTKPLWTAADIRRGGWQAIFAGACGYTYGVNSIWQMHNGESKTHPPIAPPTTAYTNWFHELDLPGAYAASLMRTITLSLPNYFTRIPDDSFILSDRNEPSDGTPAGDKLVLGMRAKGWAGVHLPYGGHVEVDLEKALPSEGEGEYRAWWIDPRTGGKETIGKGKSDGPIKGSRRFEAPDKEDWLLLLESVSGTPEWFVRK
ncbi:hypothetical protein EHS25_009929 [Saitozyma podzolica]|uniref:DUF4038 domain-containing protein n=1 Tax=Saitozyma podzolica TaxID=1890683 RepID=A0A427YI46_9TREE|nr:hypothetical protein EHS25_009929 [Saitozyma podzolica]